MSFFLEILHVNKYSIGTPPPHDFKQTSILGGSKRVMGVIKGGDSFHIGHPKKIESQ